MYLNLNDAIFILVLQIGHGGPVAMIWEISGGLIHDHGTGLSILESRRTSNSKAKTRGRCKMAKHFPVPSGKH